MPSTADDARARIEAVVADVRRRLLAELPERVARNAALARAAVSGDAAAADALRIDLHSLAGSAGTVGLPALGAQARALEMEILSATEARVWPAGFADRVAALAAD
ncbi:Hpt domain-containing protein [Methylopila musalis]|uniref:Hpt domain-containing protein n=1 Tax=Methylopila musalis TaxID=1134781 RepID=A0ABW3Z3Z5_9HYPH